MAPLIDLYRGHFPPIGELRVEVFVRLPQPEAMRLRLTASILCKEHRGHSLLTALFTVTLRYTACRPLVRLPLVLVRTKLLSVHFLGN